VRPFITSYVPSGLLLKRCLSLSMISLSLIASGSALAASAKMMWVLASFVELDPAVVEATKAHELTGQITAVQEARVGSKTWHRVLVTPATEASSEARLASLLRSANYDQTWRVWLSEADVGKVTWFGGQPSDFPDPLDASLEAAPELIGDKGMLADLGRVLDDRERRPEAVSMGADLTESSRQKVDQLLAPDVDYHPIRLRAQL
jgi:hypothetical protein